MGVFLATIRWEDAPQAIEKWKKARTTERKLKLIKEESELTGTHYSKMAICVLDEYTALSKERAKLAHGFFGIVTDRQNEFAWRNGSSAAERMATGFATPTIKATPPPKTWIYKPIDFANLAQRCADAHEKIDLALTFLPIVKGLTDPVR